MAKSGLHVEDMISCLKERNVDMVFSRRVQPGQIFIDKVMKLSGEFHTSWTASDDHKMQNPLLLFLAHTRERRPLEAVDHRLANPQRILYALKTYI